MRLRYLGWQRLPRAALRNLHDASDAGRVPDHHELSSTALGWCGAALRSTRAQAHCPTSPCAVDWRFKNAFNEKYFAQRYGGLGLASRWGAHRIVPICCEPERGQVERHWLHTAATRDLLPRAGNGGRSDSAQSPAVRCLDRQHNPIDMSFRPAPAHATHRQADGTIGAGPRPHDGAAHFEARAVVFSDRAQ